ncbi:MAG: hypothetical protein A2096_13725 [Spirochaetes bacterium GWF1_41_5]|nr:MAG: hypothetical protein A2096_13725 [Spirochaetes bacterium GWF1_41_5]HBE03073.1 hypothetical protein [Spirochaetia bacterium]
MKNSKYLSSRRIISAALKLYRKEKGLSQPELARLIKKPMNASQIGRIERAQQSYSLQMLDRILDGLGITLPGLLSRYNTSETFSFSAARKNLLTRVYTLPELEIEFLYEITRLTHKISIEENPDLKTAGKIKKPKTPCAGNTGASRCPA